MEHYYLIIYFETLLFLLIFYLLGLNQIQNKVMFEKDLTGTSEKGYT